MKKDSGLMNRISEEFHLNYHVVGSFFLGVGLTMFMLNITAVMQLIPYMAAMKSIYGVFPMHGFYVSVLSSMILMVYSLYNMYYKG